MSKTSILTVTAFCEPNKDIQSTNMCRRIRSFYITFVIRPRSPKTVSSCQFEFQLKSGRPRAFVRPAAQMMIISPIMEDWIAGSDWLHARRAKNKLCMSYSDKEVAEGEIWWNLDIWVLGLAQALRKTQLPPSGPQRSGECCVCKFIVSIYIE